MYFLKENNFEITKNIFKSTHILCVWHDLLLLDKFFWVKSLKKFLHFKVITVITNDITFDPEKIEQTRKYVDVFIAPSDKIYNFLKRKKLIVYRIPFFVNPEVFNHLSISKENICRKLNIDWQSIKNKIVIGSFQRDSLGKDLSQPKWQKNPDLLIKILKRFPKKDYILLLAGPRRHYIVNKCKKEKIPFLFYGDVSYVIKNKDDIKINNLPLEIINYLYNLTDLYLITSKSEGGPKQVLEASFTKTLIFSTRVGLSPDVLHSFLLFEETHLSEVIKKIQKFFRNSSEFEKYIEYNFQKAKKEMNLGVLKQKYKELILFT